MTAAVFLLAGLAGAFAPMAALGQGFNPAQAPPWIFADNYGRFALQGQGAGVYTFSPSSICQVTQLGFANRPTFYAFSNTAALAPVFIDDVNAANAEVVTPGSYFTPTATTCGVNLSPSNAHTTFTLQSGTGGLQEAVNSVAKASSGGQLYTIVLSPEWYKLISGIASLNATLTASVTPASVIAAATCSSNTQLVDVTANPWTYWGCNASDKFAMMTPRPPSTAAGAGAGSGPTLAMSAGSSNSSGTVTLTTGTTPTASDPIFTVTFGPPDYGGGFPYAPACTVTSVGATAYTGTVTTTAGSGTSGGTLVYTATSTAPAASTAGFAWTWSCH